MRQIFRFRIAATLALSLLAFGAMAADQILHGAIVDASGKPLYSPTN